LKLAAQFVVSRDSIDVMVKSEYAQRTNVSTNGNARVAFFKASERLPGHAHALRKQNSRDVAPTSGQA
jgi:hypothetical protein